MENPNKPPRIIVMMHIGISLKGSFKPIMNEFGKKHRIAINIPFRIQFIVT